MDDAPPQTLVSATTPRGEIALRERPHPDGRGSLVHELVVAGVFAMDSLDTSTEAALALESLTRTDSPERVLVGGLGLGFTTWQVLKDKRVRHVDVVEIETDLVEWARLGLAPTLVETRLVVGEPLGAEQAAQQEAQQGPQMSLQVNVSTTPLGDTDYETVLKLEGKAAMVTWPTTLET